MDGDLATIGRLGQIIFEGVDTVDDRVDVFSNPQEGDDRENAISSGLTVLGQIL